MVSYDQFYARISAPFRKRPALLQALRYTNRSMTFLMPVLYVGLLFYVAIMEPSRMRLLLYVLIPAVSFVVLSVFRSRLNAPRPYETWELQPLLTKETSGRSMPSRHVFSATVISMCLLHQNGLLGAICLFLSALLAVVRVIGGVHYPKDVVVGYGLAILVGLGLFFI